MALPIVALPPGTLATKLAQVVFGDESDSAKSPLSPAKQMQAALALIETLGDVPRPDIERMAVKIDSGVVRFLEGAALRTVCQWLHENHPNVCASMPRVTVFMDSMVRATGYNAWFQPGTLARLERALEGEPGAGSLGTPTGRGFGVGAGGASSGVGGLEGEGS